MAATFVCADAVEWLTNRRDVGAVVTSLPDAAETGMAMERWEGWFVAAAHLCMSAASESAPAVFYQTDRKADGKVYSKSALLFAAASRGRIRLLWHKVVLRRGVGKIDLHRPGYTHLMAFSVGGKPGAATPDVIDAGKMIYPNAMGMNAALLSVRFAQSTCRRLVDPFCGRGTVPVLADALGMTAIGVDIDQTQVDAARKLRFSRR
jgi:hypothetical protein